MEHAGGVGADVAKTLDGDADSVERLVLRREEFSQHDHDPAPGRLLAPDRSADAHRLARHHAKLLMSDHHAVRVEQPRHHLRIGSRIRRGNILVRPDDRHDLAGVSSRQPLFLAHRQLSRIADHAALGAAEGDVGDRALPCHPRGQCPHFVHGYVGMIADAAFAWSTHLAVQHPMADERPHRTVVHLMTEMLEPQPGESIYDPTCGSGGMLLSCIAHLRRLKKESRNVVKPDPFPECRRECRAALRPAEQPNAAEASD